MRCAAGVKKLSKKKRKKEGTNGISSGSSAKRQTLSLTLLALDPVEAKGPRLPAPGIEATTQNILHFL
jgi:hypothetical protein